MHKTQVQGELVVVVVAFYAKFESIFQNVVAVVVVYCDDNELLLHVSLIIPKEHIIQEYTLGHVLVSADLIYNHNRLLYSIVVY